MTTGVHHRHFVAVPVGAHNGGGIGQTGKLFHGQAVHVCSHHNHRSGAIFHHGHNACAAHAFGDLELNGSKLFGQSLGRFELH